MVHRIAATLALLLATAAHAAPPERVSPADLRARIAVLADDSYEGRKPGTEGGAKTGAYVIDAFARAGLKPAAADGSWRQPVTLVRRTPVSAMLTLGGVSVPAADLAFAGRDAAEKIDNAPVWFVGAGTKEQIEGADLKGAVVLIAGDAPGGGHGLGERLQLLASRGAVAIITIPAANIAWGAYVAEQGGRARLAGTGAQVEGGLSREAAVRLAEHYGQSYDTLVAATKQPDFRAMPLPDTASLTAETRITPFQTANIIGKVAGSDPSAGAVLLSAHWDHLGLCRPEGAPDRICNGADDNASGTAMLIEIARRVAAGPRPVRDVYFLSTTAEELGLVGARAFAAAPPVPLTKIVAALNIDTAAIAPAGMPVAIMGRGRTPALDAAIDATTRKLGRTVDGDNEADVMFPRQDGWALAERGVPAVMVSGSFSDMKLLMDYLRGTYHGPSDDLAHLPTLDGTAEDATLHVALARALADPKIYPAPAAKAQ